MKIFLYVPKFLQNLCEVSLHFSRVLNIFKIYSMYLKILFAFITIRCGEDEAFHSMLSYFVAEYVFKPWSHQWLWHDQGTSRFCATLFPGVAHAVFEAVHVSNGVAPTRRIHIAFSNLLLVWNEHSLAVHLSFGQTAALVMSGMYESGVEEMRRGKGNFGTHSGLKKIKPRLH